MGHLTAKGGYPALRRQLDKNSIGAPDTEQVRRVLEFLFTLEEAELASRMPLKFSTAEQIAAKAGGPPAQIADRLARMADKGLVLDFEIDGELRFLPAPTLLGFFEFSMMRVRTDVDQKRLAELLHDCVVDSGSFVGAFDPDDTITAPMRALVHETSLDEGTFAEVLDYEKATHLIKEANTWAVGNCYCRHIQQHRGNPCVKSGMEVCMSLNIGAEFLIRHRFAEPVSRERALDLVSECRDAGLVQLADNVKHRPTFICNCCGCCCEVMLSFKKFRLFGDTFSSNYESVVDPSRCTGCGKCARVCPIDAVSMEPFEHEVNGQRVKKTARVDNAICLGCGVCTPSCEFGALRMEPREQRKITPETMFHRVLCQALEQGKLHHLVFEDQDGWSAAAMNRLMGAMLNLSPVKKLLLREQVKSRFLDLLIKGTEKAGIKVPDM